jgi:hypothetical protein
MAAPPQDAAGHGKRANNESANTKEHHQKQGCVSISGVILSARDS